MNSVSRAPDAVGKRRNRCLLARFFEERWSSLIRAADMSLQARASRKAHGQTFRC